MDHSPEKPPTRPPHSTSPFSSFASRLRGSAATLGATLVRGADSIQQLVRDPAIRTRARDIVSRDVRHAASLPKRTAGTIASTLTRVQERLRAARIRAALSASREAPVDVQIGSQVFEDAPQEMRRRLWLALIEDADYRCVLETGVGISRALTERQKPVLVPEEEAPVSLATTDELVSKIHDTLELTRAFSAQSREADLLAGGVGRWGTEAATRVDVPPAVGTSTSVSTINPAGLTIDGGDLISLNSPTAGTIIAPPTTTSCTSSTHRHQLDDEDAPSRGLVLPEDPFEGMSLPSVPPLRPRPRSGPHSRPVSGRSPSPADLPFADLPEALAVTRSKRPETSSTSPGPSLRDLKQRTGARSSPTPSEDISRTQGVDESASARRIEGSIGNIDESDYPPPRPRRSPDPAPPPGRTSPAPPLVDLVSCEDHPPVTHVPTSPSTSLSASESEWELVGLPYSSSPAHVPPITSRTDEWDLTSSIAALHLSTSELDPSRYRVDPHAKQFTRKVQRRMMAIHLPDLEDVDPLRPGSLLANLLSVEEGQAAVDDEIERDLHRTFPGHPFFSTSKGRLALFRVLKGYSVQDLEVGYCQGMAFVAGVLLMYVPSEAAFHLLKQLMLPSGADLRQMYLPGFTPLRTALARFDYELRSRRPDVADHLEQSGIPSVLYASQWLLTAFSNPFPAPFSARVIDMLLQEKCIDPLLRVSIAIVLRAGDAVLSRHGLEDIMVELKERPVEWSGQVHRKVLQEAAAVKLDMEWHEQGVTEVSQGGERAKNETATGGPGGATSTHSDPSWDDLLDLRGGGDVWLPTPHDRLTTESETLSSRSVPAGMEVIEEQIIDRRDLVLSDHSVARLRGGAQEDLILTDLPVDVLVQIATLVEDARDLVSLSLVSTLFGHPREELNGESVISEGARLALVREMSAAESGLQITSWSNLHSTWPSRLARWRVMLSAWREREAAMAMRFMEMSMSTSGGCGCLMGKARGRRMDEGEGDFGFL